MIFDNREEWYRGNLQFLPRHAVPIYVKVRGSEVAHPISEQENRILNSLVGCRDLDQHIEHLRTSAPESIVTLGDDDLKRLFGRWIEQGLLRNRSELHSRVPRDSKTADVPQKCLVGTVTAERPLLLRRWIEDFVANREWKQTAPTIVVDDSRSDDGIQRTGATVSEFVEQGVTVVNREARARWARAITERIQGECVDPEIVRWGLVGTTEGYGASVVSIGAARNTMLLAGMDRLVVSIDDDMLPEYAVFTDSDSSHICLGDEYVPWARLFPKYDDLSRSKTVATDPTIGLIQSLGGVSLEGADLRTISSEIAGDLEEIHGRIVAARLGTFGGRAVQEPYRIVQRRSEFGTREPDQRTIQEIQENGIRGRHTTALTVGRHGFVPAYTSFDGSWEFPPFFPWAGQADDVFWAQTSWQDTRAFLAEYPVAVRHDDKHKSPIPKRLVGRYAVGAGLYNLLTLHFFARDIVHRDTRGKKSALIRRYREIGTLNPSEFRDFLRHIQSAHLTEVREDIESQIAMHRAERDRREPYARELLLRRYQDSVIRELATPESVVPTELRDQPGTIDEKLAFLHENYRKWGDLLEAWPAIRQAAGEIGFDRLIEIATTERK